MRTANEILVVTLGEKGYNTLSKVKIKSIIKAMESYRSEPEYDMVDNVPVVPETKKKDTSGFVDASEVKDKPKPEFGIVVDGSTTGGNPGNSEYQAVNLGVGEYIFNAKIGKTTNNICEFMAIVHAIKYTKENGLPLPIYSDSTTAISWLKKRKAKSQTDEWTKKLLARAFEYLGTIEIPEIRKWDTRAWGENPADFLRK